MVDASLQFDTACRILADPRRRAIVRLLDAEERRLTLNDLTKEIASRERDVPIADRTKEELVRIYLSLQHVHVPTLDDAGVVDYDRDRETVAPTNRLDTLLGYLGALEPESLDGSPPDDRPVP